jgi:hypothetical protein
VPVVLALVIIETIVASSNEEWLRREFKEGSAWKGNNQSIANRV